MLSPADATQIVVLNHPFGRIQKYIEYQNLYIFMVFNNLPGEEEMDPFFSVDKDTGAFAEFGIFTDGDIDVVLSLFEQKK